MNAPVKPQTRPKTGCGLWANIAISSGAIVVALIFLEMGLRVLDGPLNVSRFSAETGWRGQANEFKILDTDGYKHPFQLNSQGMHDTEHPLTKPANTYRIMLLGDSFVEARQVIETETAHQILEDLLNKSGSEKQYSVISAGVPAWGTGQQLLYYRSQGRQFQPDLVVLMVYLGNDITDNLPVHSVKLSGVDHYAPYFALCNGMLDPEPWVYAPGVTPTMGNCSPTQKQLAEQLQWLYWHTHLYRVLGPLFNLRQLEFFNKDLPNIHLYVPLDNETFRQSFPRENHMLDYGWRVTFEIIKELQREVEANGSQLAIVLIDSAEVINLVASPPEAQAARAESMPYLALTEPDLPEKKFRQALAETGIEIFNLQTELVDYTRQHDESLFFPHDKHWNQLGNRVVAGILYDWLEDRWLSYDACISHSPVVEAC
ncbi:MAG: SGNH/GDSL hydrolase family protein [Anaerolineae bacterium]|nr:SGNH/GDSL hydrolase family protein [Anaerolineae bacterium]